MRRTPLVTGEYYHIFNRGVLGDTICFEHRDYARLLFSLLYFQSEMKIDNLPYHVDQYDQWNTFGVFRSTEEEIVSGQYIELVSFCLMPNHFHALVKEKKAGGISKWMQRVQTSYTKYVNEKYDRSGHLFQGPFQLVHVSDDNQLTYLSAYIHRNPHDLKRWRAKEHIYPWSSYQDFVSNNRWDDLLTRDIVLDRFDSPSDYHGFVKNTRAKELKKFEV